MRHRVLLTCFALLCLVSVRLAISADEGRKWAVVIGVNKYLDPKIPPLKYCVADAHRVFEALTRQSGFDPDHVLLIVDDQTHDHLLPLRMNFQLQIGDWLQHAQAEDTVVVHYSGHGFVDEATGEGFLAPKDCLKNDLRGTGFPTERLRQMLRDCPARQKLLILDCCHAGAVRSGKATGSTGEELSQAFAKAQGLVTLASCRKDEVSYEWETKGQGLFTYFLTEGLGGGADYDRDGVVNADELYRYTFEKVQLAAQRELNARQRPVRVIGPETEGVFALSRVSVTARPLADSVTALFTVREEDSSGRLLEGAEVELFYRESAGSRLEALGASQTDAGGTARIPVTLSLSQQARGSFGVMVRMGTASQSYTLDKFPQTRSYALYVPRSTPLSPSPKPTPSPPGQTLATSIGMKLVLIPAGQFQMGSPESDLEAYDYEKPQHTVRITKPFYLGVTEVTQAQYERVMETNPSTFKGADLPVETVSWEDAVEFCRKLSAKEGRTYRLPTEAEWEYACRAGSQTKWCFGNNASEVGEYAWYLDNADMKTHPVGLKKANAWGLYDMHGNVWEWCSDWRGQYPSTAVADPTGATAGSYRVDRGGSWIIGARYCRSAYRYDDAPGNRNGDLGFRVASSSVDATGK